MEIQCRVSKKTQLFCLNFRKPLWASSSEAEREREKRQECKGKERQLERSESHFIRLYLFNKADKFLDDSQCSVEAFLSDASTWIKSKNNIRVDMTFFGSFATKLVRLQSVSRSTSTAISTTCHNQSVLVFTLVLISTYLSLLLYDTPCMYE